MLSRAQRPWSAADRDAVERHFPGLTPERTKETLKAVVREEQFGELLEREAAAGGKPVHEIGPEERRAMHLKELYELDAREVIKWLRELPGKHALDALTDFRRAEEGHIGRSAPGSRFNIAIAGRKYTVPLNPEDLRLVQRVERNRTVLPTVADAREKLLQALAIQTIHQLTRSIKPQEAEKLRAKGLSLGRTPVFDPKLAGQAATLTVQALRGHSTEPFDLAVSCITQALEHYRRLLPGHNMRANLQREFEGWRREPGMPAFNPAESMRLGRRFDEAMERRAALKTEGKTRALGTRKILRGIFEEEVARARARIGADREAAQTKRPSAQTRPRMPAPTPPPVAPKPYGVSGKVAGAFRAGGLNATYLEIMQRAGIRLPANALKSEQGAKALAGQLQDLVGLLDEVRNEGKPNQALREALMQSRSMAGGLLPRLERLGLQLE